MKVSRFFRRDGQPDGELVIGQAPNSASIVTASALTGAIIGRNMPEVRDVMTAVACGAALKWSYDELKTGESPFRRVVGGVGLIATIGATALFVARR